MKGDIMKTKKYVIVAAVIGCIAVFLTIKAIGITKHKFLKDKYRERLQKSSGVTVYVEVVVSKPNLDESRSISNKCEQELNTEVELELRKYGIQVLDEATVFAPSLKVDVFATNHSTENDFYTYCYMVQHHELATLDRTKLKTPGICWHSDLVLGRGGLDDLKKGVIVIVRNYINDYLAANPKEEPAKKQIEKPIFDSIWMDRLN